MIPATCHPDRRHQARGLCDMCYRRDRNHRLGVYKPRGTLRPATCHPDRRHHARGLCAPCYRPDPAKKRAELLRHVHGLTVEEFDRLVAEQGGRCAICGRAPDDRLHVDHDHRTGQRRGLLCNTCNRALGLFHDDPDVLDAAVAYLGRRQPLRAVRSA